MARRQVCWAHLKRDLTAFSQSKEAAGGWGARAVAAQMFALWHRFKHGALDRLALQAQMAEVRATFHALLHEGQAILHYKVRAFCGDLLKLEAGTRFVDLSHP